MKPYIKPIPLLCLVFFCQFFPGCVNMHQVQDFAVSADKGLALYNELPYTYTRFCYDRCRLEQLEAVKLNAIACTCTDEATADSITNVMYNVLGGYFDGLVRLSGATLTDYHYENLATALQETNVAGIHVNSTNVQAYGTLAGIVSKVITDGYRRKKLGVYIATANAAVQNIVQALQLNAVENLTGKLDVKKQRWESYYFDLLKQKDLSSYEKKQVIDEYTAMLQQLNSERKQLQAYNETLREMAAGHQTLYDNRNKLNKKEMRQLAGDIARQVKSAITVFKKIKN